VLNLKTKETSVEIPVNTGLTGVQGLISIAIEFYIRPYRFEAKLSLGEDRSAQGMSVTGEIKTSGALSGEGSIRLGENKTTPKDSHAALSATPQAVKETEPADSKAKETESPSAAADKDAAEITVQAEKISLNTDEKAVVEKTQPVIATTVWDEFAVLYSSTPLLPEEILTADNDSEETKEKPNADKKPAENAKTPVKAPAPPAAKPETRQKPGTNIPASAKDEAKPNQADYKPADANAALKTEASLADIQPDNTATEQGSAAETQQGLETKTTDEEEASLLISVQ